ncbi:hypothetical protein HHI36_023743 [Cryptolaemus montrouzieri]|uniref:Uncharacterized protein n=1 Tax=Cryptolaemus montrouzieri TaxID=559131 RepID=A0ABD2PHY1_9CUCU
MGQAECLITPEDALPPFTLREIGKRVAHMKKKSTATGSDGIRRSNVNHWVKKEVLHLLYNFLLLCGKQPTEWRMNRTILLPKEGKDGSRVA